MANKCKPNVVWVDAGWTAVWTLSRVMKAAGWTYMSSSDGSAAKEVTGVASADKWGGAVDPMTDTIPTLVSGAWWCAQMNGCTKIPIASNVSTGIFIPGEPITQATSGATGQLQGYNPDSSGGTGYIVAFTRTGTFDNTHTITGTWSGATLVPSGTIIQYVQEIVIWGDGTTTSLSVTSKGHIYRCYVDTVAENTTKFSYLAINSAGCTATVAPGGGGTNNTMSTAAGFMACHGTASSTAVGTGSKAWSGLSGTTYMIATPSKAQVMVANAAASAGVSPDGTFTFAQGIPAGNQGRYIAAGLHILDDCEPGEVDPYVYVGIDGHALYAGSRTAMAAVYAMAANNIEWMISAYFTPYQSTNSSWIRGTRALGLAGASWSEFEQELTATRSASATVQETALLNNTYPDLVATAPTAQRVRKPIGVTCTNVSGGTNYKCYKGRFRWLWWMTSPGAYQQTFDTKTYIDLSGSTGYHHVCVGPYDGSTVPNNGGS